MPREKALMMAQDAKLDLVVVNFQARPPIAKIIDWGKHRYLLAKKKKASRRNELKEIQLRINIGDHDLATKIQKGKKFLSQFKKIKLAVIMRGRENIYPQKANALIEKFSSAVGGEIEQPAKRMGNRFSVIIIIK